jgi:lactoylglutathione lyase
MHIEHIAIWTHDLDGMRDFYETWFNAVVGRHYTNLAKGFESCFLTFSSGARMEIMRSTDLTDSLDGAKLCPGYAHIAFSVGSEEEVDSLTERMRHAGLTIVDGPRRTGDGYYESLILDPDGNRVEITV